MDEDIQDDVLSESDGGDEEWYSGGQAGSRDDEDLPETSSGIGRVGAGHRVAVFLGSSGSLGVDIFACC